MSENFTSWIETFLASVLKQYQIFLIFAQFRAILMNFQSFSPFWRNFLLNLCFIELPKNENRLHLPLLHNFGFGPYQTMLCFYIGDLFKCLLSLTHCLFCFLQLKSAKDPESTSSGNSPDLTLTSRPMSEESSLWDDTDTEVRRRQNKVHQVSYSF